ncbi:MAG: class I SAM-dependent RNA methyltransferase [Sulfuricella denitrificans]|nr:class I SAM-dependent RNA methyltransferase [Sulfuricella denitrificans]
MSESFFAPCPRGLESALVAELEALGATSLQATDGGAGFSGSFELCYRANLESRIASRILWRVGNGHYRREEDIYKAAYALPWQDWFDSSRTIMVKVSARRCPLQSLDFITLRIKDAVCDKFRDQTSERPSIDTHEPDLRIHAFLEEASFALYLDTSGPALFKRGLRRASVEAPLRENLAAGILHLTGWTPGETLLDPMCGSGTFLMEAAQMALDIAPGLGREFAFSKLRFFDSQIWEKLRRQAEIRRKPVQFCHIYGGDLFGDVLKVARENLAAAGLLGAVELKQCNVLEMPAPSPQGVLVTNPPYGVRIGEQEELAAMYPELGHALKQKFSGWRAYFFTADFRLAKLIRLSASRRIPLFNGPLECRLFEYRMVAGGMRREKPTRE